MKKFIFLAVLAIATALGVSAEKGDISLGAQFAYASKTPWPASACSCR